ncbi:Rv3654c family TadE-like protein [Actinomyces trachealis]|uniref:Rv3654c family TadE-like protein n=1 Tax=Actinomyces trachealis TaxID=2763540 RepID=UPI001892A00B|nr:Rv3654c family TadE-like protein [Actinomyces trachealis]
MNRLHLAAERGSGTVLTLGVLAVLLTLGLLITGLVQAQAATACAHAGADLAALGGATALTSITAPANPCDTASQVAAANGVELSACEVVGEDVTVQVRASARVLGVARVATAAARAGPTDTP